MKGLFEQAVALALDAHEGAHRKSDGVPYILHPLEVASIAASITNDEEILAAAVLHDTVEDAGVTLEELERRFGRRVADLVASETEDKYRDQPADQTWERRKRESLEILSGADDPAVKILWLADKLSNMRSFYRAYLKSGDRLWENFHQKDPARQSWYYHEVARLSEELRETPVWREYNKLLEVVFRGN